MQKKEKCTARTVLAEYPTFRALFPPLPPQIIVHGLFPNGKCKPESNLIASLLIKNKINALTIDLRNYGQSTVVSKYAPRG